MGRALWGHRAQGPRTRLECGLVLLECVVCIGRMWCWTFTFPETVLTEWDPYTL